MIAEVDDRLADWAAAIAGEAGVRFTAAEAAAEQAGGACVLLHLLELADAGAVADLRQAEATVELRYLVAAFDADPRAEHRLLDRLLAAALSRRDFAVEFPGSPLDVWSRLGCPARPCFLIKLTTRYALSMPGAPEVVRPVVAFGGALPMDGQVLGPGDRPLANARVEVVGAGLATRTDAAGRFSFAAVPETAPPRRLRIRARGRDFVAQVARSEGAPVIVRFDHSGD